MNPPSERLVAVAMLALILAALLCGCTGPLIDNSRGVYVYQNASGVTFNAEAWVEKQVGTEAEASPTVKGVSYLRE